MNHEIIPYSPKLADLTLAELQDARIVSRNSDYQAIEATYVELPSQSATSSNVAATESVPQHDRLALALSVGAFTIASLSIAYLVGKAVNAAPTPVPTPSSPPTPVIVIPPSRSPGDRCLAFCFGD